MSDNPQVEALDLASISFLDALGVCALCSSTWPGPDASPEAEARQLLADQQAGRYLPGAHVWYLLRQEGRILAAAQTFPRPITIAGRPLTILALASVCTLPESRGHGLGSLVVRAAFTRVDQQQYPYGFFQTSHRNRPFYERLGCARVPSPILNSLPPDSGRNPFWDEIAMYYPASKPWPEGEVDTLGPGW